MIIYSLLSATEFNNGQVRYSNRTIPACLALAPSDTIFTNRHVTGIAL